MSKELLSEIKKLKAAISKLNGTADLHAKRTILRSLGYCKTISKTWH